MLICKSRRLDNDLVNVKPRIKEYPKEKTLANEDYFDEVGELEDDIELNCTWIAKVQNCHWILCYC